MERKGTPLIAVMIELASHRKELRRIGNVVAAVAAVAVVVKVFIVKIRQRQDKKWQPQKISLVGDRGS